MKNFNFSSKFTFIYQNVSFFTLCTITFRGLSQGSQLGPAFAKAGPGYSYNVATWKQEQRIFVYYTYSRTQLYFT